MFELGKTPGFLARALSPLVMVALCAAGSLANAQEAAVEERPEQPIYQRIPFDVIELTPEHGSYRLIVDPLDFPGRTPPDDLPGGRMLQFVIQDRPGERYEVPWASIDHFELFEDQVLAAAIELSKQKRFDESFDHFDFLLTYRDRPRGFDAALETFIKEYARHFLATGRPEDALSLLLQLAEIAPGAAGLPQAYARVVGELADQRLQHGEWFAARELLLEARERFPDADLGPIDERLSDLRRRAASELAQASSAAAEERWLDAFLAVRKAASYWPQGDDYLDLAHTVAGRYPAVVVGVTAAAPPKASAGDATVDWAASRTLRLQMRMPCEFDGLGAEGGVYRQPLAAFAVEPGAATGTARLDGSALAAGFDGFSLASLLLSAASGADADAALAAGLAGASASVGETQLEVVESLAPLGRFQVAPPCEPEVFWRPIRDIVTPYRSLEQTAGEQAFVANDAYFDQANRSLAAVVEKQYRSRSAAWGAMVRGEVQVVDRLHPTDVARARQTSDVSVVPYGAPRIHALAFNPKSTEPLVADHTFRRALAYALDRTAILKHDVLSGADIPGCGVVSGPFPLGKAVDDPIAYAYDRAIAPRRYDLRLAIMLARVSALQHALTLHPDEAAPDADDQPAESNKATSAPSTLVEQIELPKLRLLHSDDDVVRLACERIAGAWRRVGLRVELVTAPSPEAIAWDVRYVELAMWDPIQDARRLLALDGYLDLSDDYVALALNRVDAAETWGDAREALYEVHRVVHSNVALIPLWQIYEYAAVDRRLEGLRPGLPTLYHDVETWRPPATLAEGASP